MNEFPLAPKRRRVPTAVWLLGGVLLLVLLAAQVVYFYAPQLARDARLKPWLALYCERAGCDLKPPRGTLSIELVQTSVAPHPRYENALRLSAVLVNRAEQAQSHPVMEVSLTDSEGQVLARRSFTPAQYLESPPPMARWRRTSPCVRISTSPTPMAAPSATRYVWSPHRNNGCQYLSVRSRNYFVTRQIPNTLRFSCCLPIRHTAQQRIVEVPL